MKRILAWMVGAGMTLGAAISAQAAPAASGLHGVDQAATRDAGALTHTVGWRRGHYYRVSRPVYRPVRVYRHAGFYRPVRYARPVYYRHVRYARPIYYRPIRYRPIYAGPAFARPVYGYGHRRCFVRYRTFWTAYGYVQRPVRICRW